MQNAQFELKNFEKLGWMYKNEPDKYSQIASARELNNRADKINNTLQKFKELETTVRMATSNVSSGSSI
jgi:hypothetical protein